MGKKNTGPIEDDGTLFGYYEERRRRSLIRNPTRSTGDDKPADNGNKGSSKKDQR
jgi:hypothetical protein